ncbi:MAG: MalY/PatB family protein [Saccharofermentanales bacterium]
MKYNFEERRSRANMGSYKWNAMGDQPEEVIPFSTADMELLSPPEIIEALKKVAEFGMWGYTWWDEKYSDAMCHWLKTRHGWEIDPSWIVQLNGVVQGLYAGVRAFSEPGDKILINTPVYGPFYRAINLNNRVVVENELVLRDGRYEIDFEDFEEKAKTAKIFILCSPHNPVGRVWTAEELKRMGDICNKYNVLVFADEIHYDFVMPGYKHICYATLGEEYAENSITFNAASKTFSLAGLCVGNAIVSNKNIREPFDLEVNVSGCYTYSIFGNQALVTAYTECSQWVDEVIQHVFDNYTYFKNYMNKHHPEIWVADMEGTYLAWFDCRCFGMESKELGEFLEKEAQLFFDHGYIFGSAGDGFERINLACPKKDLENALQRFTAAVSKL